MTAVAEGYLVAQSSHELPRRRRFITPVECVAQVTPSQKFAWLVPEPRRFFLAWTLGAVTEENVEPNLGRDGSARGVGGTSQVSVEGFHRRVDVLGPSQQAAELLMELKLVTPCACYKQGREEPFIFLGARFAKVLANHADLLRMQRRKLGAGGEADSHARRHRGRSPRFSHAETVGITQLNQRLLLGGGMARIRTRTSAIKPVERCQRRNRKYCAE